MKINENMLNHKYKVLFTFKAFEKEINLNSIIKFNSVNLIVKLPSKKNSVETIQELLKIITPIYHQTEKDNKIIHINYSLIDNFYLDETNKINIIIINPILKKTIKFFIKTIEKCNLVFGSKLKDNKIILLIRTINELIQNEKIDMVNKIFYFTKSLLDISNRKNLGTVIDNDILIKSFMEGKKYYNKSIAELIKRQKIKHCISKRIISESFYHSENYFLDENINEIDYNNSRFDYLIPEIKLSLIEKINEVIEFFIDINLKENETIDNEKDDENKSLKNNIQMGDIVNCNFQQNSNFFYKIKNAKILGCQNIEDRKTNNFDKKLGDSNLNTESTIKSKKIKFNLFKEIHIHQQKIKFNSSILDTHSKKSKKHFALKRHPCNKENKSKLNFTDNAIKHKLRISSSKLLEYNLDNDNPAISYKLLNKTHFNFKHNFKLLKEKNKVINLTNDKEDNKFIENNYQNDFNESKKIENGLSKSKIKIKENQNKDYKATKENSEQCKMRLIDIKIAQQNALTEKINHLKERHLFSVNSSIDEVFSNTIEVIIRKYFEVLFEGFFEKTFIYKKDNGFLNLDSFFSILFYIKELKYIVMQDNMQKEYIEILQTEFHKNFKQMEEIIAK
jgi:hypothetical protein